MKKRRVNDEELGKLYGARAREGAKELRADPTVEPAALAATTKVAAAIDAAEVDDARALLAGTAFFAKTVLSEGGEKLTTALKANDLAGAEAAVKDLDALAFTVRTVVERIKEMARG